MTFTFDYSALSEYSQDNVRRSTPSCQDRAGMPGSVVNSKPYRSHLIILIHTLRSSFQILGKSCLHSGATLPNLHRWNGVTGPPLTNVSLCTKLPCPAIQRAYV